MARAGKSFEAHQVRWQRGDDFLRARHRRHRSSSPTITSRLRKNLKNGRLLSNCAVSTGSKNPFVRNLLEPAIFNYVSSDVMNALQAKDAARFHHLLMLLVSLAAEPHYFKHPLLNQTPALVAGIASPHAAGLRALPAVVATGDIGRNHN